MAHYLSPSYWQLPQERELSNGKVIFVDLLHDSQISDAYRLVEKAKGKGLGMDEIPDKDSFLYLIQRAVAFAVTDRDEGGKLIGVWCAYPAPICRSFKTKMHADYIVLDEKYKGNGVPLELGPIMACLWAVLGFQGGVFRVSRWLPYMDIGGLATGVIPRSRLLKSGHRGIDIIAHFKHTANLAAHVCI